MLNPKDGEESYVEEELEEVYTEEEIQEDSFEAEEEFVEE